MISIGILGDDVTGIELELLLDNEELSTVISYQNTATQLIDNRN